MCEGDVQKKRWGLACAKMTVSVWLSKSNNNTSS